MRLVFLGPPGAGKGTQARRLRGRYSFPHISTGEIFRAELEARTELGLLADSYTRNGNLVPDEVVIGIVAKRLGRDDCREHGFLLDGFPRTIPQARALDERLEQAAMPLDAALLLEVDDDEILARRLEGRLICPGCGNTHHRKFLPPAPGGERCGECGAELVRRKDDVPETIRQRLSVDRESTRPIDGYYEARGILVRLDGRDTPEVVEEALGRELKRIEKGR